VLSPGRGQRVLELIITFGAAVAVIWGFLKWVWPRLKVAAQTVVAFKNAVLGTEEVLHPDTGKTLVPAQPGLGARVASIEVTLTELVRTNRRLDDHERRLGSLEEASAERAAARTETVELLRVVDTALKTQPPEEQ
jgi:hypothetical protein